MVKFEKEKMVGTINSVSNLCGMIMGIKDSDELMDVLTKCQEAVISVGEKLESSDNSIDKKSIGELQIISKLEEFCELLYQCSIECNDRIVVKMNNLLKEVLVMLDMIPRTYRIAFLPYKASMWDSLESIWRCFAKDERCETSVVPIPYFEANRQLNQWDTCYEGNQYPSDVPIVYFQDYLLGDKKPDVVFVHYPFDKYNHVTTVHPAYYSEELKKHCGKLVYVPYYANSGFLSDNYNLLPLLYRADYLVFQSEQMKESCKEYPYYDRVLTFGSPKFDKVINMVKEKVEPPKEWDMDFSGKTKLLLNTTLTDFLQNGELLMNKLRRFFEVVKEREDLVIIWRPHPLLEGSVKAMRPQYIDDFQNLINYFNDNNVGVLDRTADVSRAVACSDAYIGSHYSSIIALFEVCNKPVFRFDSKNIYDINDRQGKNRANPENVFTMNDMMDLFGSYESYEYMFGDFVDDLMNDRLGEVLKMQAEQEASIANNLDGTCGEKTYEFIMNDLIENSK